MSPTLGHGKICYLQIPATDIPHASEFYRACFGWKIRKDTQGHTTFDDSVGQVSGMWVLGRLPSDTPGVIVHIMVDCVADTLVKIVAAGGTVAAPIGVDPGETTAWFRDPTGNVFGLYQERSA